MLLFAPTCAGCGAVGVDLCPGCLAALQPPPSVPTPPGLDALVSVFAYDGVGRRVVLGLKYRNRRGDVGVLGPALAAAADDALARAAEGVRPVADRPRPVVTWAPTTVGRRRRRGYDQAHWLAVAVGRSLGLPVGRLLVRLPSAPQTGARRAERWARPRFAAVRPTMHQMTSVLFIDDVSTSGATLAAAAAALRAAGSENVVAVTLAQTPLNRADPTAETQGNPVGGNTHSGWTRRTGGAANEHPS